MKTNNTLKFCILLLLIMNLNSCVSFSVGDSDETEVIAQNENIGEEVEKSKFLSPVNSENFVVPPSSGYEIMINRRYRAPDGTYYWSGNIYRDRLGYLYRNGKKIGQDKSTERAIISSSGKTITYLDQTFLPPVDFEQNLGGYNYKGLELQTADYKVPNTNGNGKNTAIPKKNRSDSQTSNTYDGGFR